MILIRDMKSRTCTLTKALSHRSCTCAHSFTLLHGPLLEMTMTRPVSPASKAIKLTRYFDAEHDNTLPMAIFRCHSSVWAVLDACRNDLALFSMHVPLHTTLLWTQNNFMGKKWASTMCSYQSLYQPCPWLSG